MTASELKKALAGQPVDLWLRLLGECENELNDKVVIVVEVLAALYRYNLIPRATAAITGVLDALAEWARGKHREQVVVINARTLMLAGDDGVVAVDAITGVALEVPTTAEPVLTAALHLPALRAQTLASLATASRAAKSEARPA